MERKLASVKKIDSIENIHYADNIEIAHIGGWQSVIKKNEYRAGDTVIFIEIDSILPLTPWSEFLRNTKDPDKPIRLKTCKLRGVISQGLVIPLDTVGSEYRKIGTDVTDILGIVKYEPPITTSTSGKPKGNFPIHIFPKTDSERIQNLWGGEFLDEINDTRFIATYKMDGTSLSMYYFEGDMGICSRNILLDSEDDNLYTSMFKKYNIEDIFKRHGKDIAIQAEIIGPGIQKNTASIPDKEIMIFDIYDISRRRYFDYEDLKHFCEEYSLPMVKVHTDNFIFNKNIHTFEYITEMTNLKYDLSRRPIEGLIFTGYKETYSPSLQGRLRFKMINPGYLLKNE